MSATTTTSTTSSTLSTIVQEVISNAPMLVALLASNKAAGINLDIQNFVTKEDAALKADLDKMQAAIDSGEAANPLVQKGVAALSTSLSTLGIKFNSETEIVAHLKAVIDDLAHVVLAPSASAPAPTAA